jgi:hypothetical protein
MRRILLGFLVLGVLQACGGGDGRSRIVFRLQLLRLPDLGPSGGHYEGYALVGGQAVSTGKFIVDGTAVPARVLSPDRGRDYGTVDSATFGPSITGLGQDFPFIEDATAFFITVEPPGDRDRVPSGCAVMGGLVLGKRADLDAIGLLPLGGPGIGALAGSTGAATLLAATGAPAQDASGAWFVVPDGGGGFLPALTLPLPGGAWTYEAWVEAPVGLLSLGRFRAVDSYDFDAQSTGVRGSSSIGLFAPGQDFAIAEQRGAAAMTDLAAGGWRVEITVEPVRDNTQGPFPLRLLSGDIPTDAVNAQGIAAREIPLQNLAQALPRLDATFTPGLLALSGSAPKGLGSPDSGVYALWTLDLGGSPHLVARFVTPDGPGLVTSPGGLVIYGGTGAFAFDPLNTGLGAAFPDPAATRALLVTQEPFAPPTPAPSEVVILRGELLAGAAVLDVAQAIADFSGAAGLATCRTPTDDGIAAAPNDRFGIWFQGLVPLPTLLLPELPPAWTYEGWVVHDGLGRRHSTGRFRSAFGPDEDAASFRGRGTAGIGFSVPGQDFLRDDPGILIPALPDLRGRAVRITLEPVPDLDPGPSPFLVLEGTLPLATLVPGAPFLDRSADLPAGRLRF